MVSTNQTVASILGMIAGGAERGEDLLTQDGGIRLDPEDVALVTDRVVKMELVCQHCFGNNWTNFNLTLSTVMQNAVAEEDDPLDALDAWLHAEASAKNLMLD